MILLKLGGEVRFEQRATHKKNLCKIYGAKFPTKQYSEIVNLINENLSEEILQIFRLRLNCHLKTKPSSLIRKVEFDKLCYDFQGEA